MVVVLVVCPTVGTSTGGRVVCRTVEVAGLESGLRVVNVTSCVSFVYLIGTVGWLYGGTV